MKTIQITMDEKLLLKLDAQQETRRIGRSAVLRQAVLEYLDRGHRNSIAAGYQRAYSDKSGSLGDEFKGWEDVGQWPPELLPQGDSTCSHIRMMASNVQRSRRRGVTRNSAEK